MRNARRGLSKGEQRQTAEQITRRLLNAASFRRAKHIALYVADDGEPDTAPLIGHALMQRKHCYLPRVVNSGVGDLHQGHASGGQRLQFVEYTPHSALWPGHFDIPSPRGPAFPAHRLDLVIMPLVAFDAEGRRVGRGGGYYDRTFALTPGKPRPQLIGIAHALQQVDWLPGEEWDIHMDAVVTPQRWFHCVNRPR